MSQYEVAQREALTLAVAELRVHVLETAIRLFLDSCSGPEPACVVPEAELSLFRQLLAVGAVSEGRAG